MKLQFGDDADAMKPRERIFTKTFWLEEFGAGAAEAFDRTATAELQGKRCLEGNNGFAEHVSNRELISEGLIQFGAVFAAHVALKLGNPPRFLKWVPHAPTTYETIVHVRGGAQWVSKCR